MRTFMLAAAMLAGSSLMPLVPAIAQDAPSTTSSASMSGPDYVKRVADLDNFEIQASRIAASRAQREDIKGFAKQMIVDHGTMSDALKAALVNKDRRITAPSTTLSSANQAKLDLLRKAPKRSFDQLYLQQQSEAHRAMLTLQQDYADNGTDPTLKQVATTAIPITTRHASALAGLTGAPM